MAKRGINLVVFEKNNNGDKDFARPTGFSIIVDEGLFNYMVDNGHHVTLVDSRVPGVFMTGKAFKDDNNNRQSSGQSKY
jgi:hypothetical protein